MADRLFLLVMFAALIGLPAQALHRYSGFGSYPDFAYYDDSLRALLQGAPLETINYFARRFNPILAALVPLYSLWADPRALLILQAVGLAITAFPLYWFARQRIGHWLALVVAIAFLGSQSVVSLNYPVFYEIKLAVPTLTFATYFLLRKRYVPFLVCLGISLLIKQEVGFVAVGFALFIFFVHKRYKLGLALGISGIGLALFVILLLYPLLNKGAVYPQFGERYSYLGHTLQEVVASLITRPDLVLSHVLTPAKMDFVLSLLVPIALVPLVGTEVTAISLPAWAYTLLSELKQQVDFGQYYQAPLIPFLFLGTVVGLERLLGWGGFSSPTAPHHRLRRKWALFVLLFTSSQLYLPATWGRILDPSSFTQSQHDAVGDQLLALIPNGATVATQTEFFVPLYSEHRANVSEFWPHVDYRNAEYLFGDSTRFWYTFRKEEWAHWRASGYFETAVEQDGYFLLRHRLLPATPPVKLENGWALYAPPANPAHTIVDTGWALIGYADKPNSFLTPLGLKVGTDLALLGFISVPTDEIQGGATLDAIAEWRAEQDVQRRYVVLAHLIDAQGHVWAQDDREPIVPTNTWRAGDIIRDQYAFRLPPTMPPGNYQISFGVWDPETAKSLDISDSKGRALGLRATVGNVQVEKDTSNIPAGYLPIERPNYVDMEEIRLLGATTLPEKTAPGEKLSLGLYWRARDKPRGDYTVSVQLRDTGGTVRLEQTDLPAAGAYPTTQWHIGEVLLDWHDLTVPADFKVGDYALVAVLRNPQDNSELGEANLGQVRIER